MRPADSLRHRDGVAAGLSHATVAKPADSMFNMEAGKGDAAPPRTPSFALR